LHDRMHRLRTRTQPLALAAALGIAAGVLAACGGNGHDNARLLSPAKASQLRVSLDRIQQQLNSGDCTSATDQAQTLGQQASGLPKGVDSDLQDALLVEVTRLQSLITQRCSPASATTGPTTPTATTGPQENHQEKAKKPKKEKGKGPTGPPGQTGGDQNEGDGGSNGNGDQQTGGTTP
jgi:hypothetical protein